jgi:DNA polymerase-1
LTCSDQGDTADNIPGIPGIGEVGAKKLLAEYGSVENVLENVRYIKMIISGTR